MVLAILTASFVGGRYLPASLLVAAMPLLVDLGLYLMAPVERTLGQRFVDAAEVRLAAAGLAVVAITGSYGKTTTKGYVAHLLSGRFSTVASPASFNNRMGLARAINEHVSSATRVFVAEMGTYGAGEIAELCAWIHPKVSVITAVGPVHLERFGTEERIVAAKREILVGAEIGVINVDHPGLAVVAAEEKARRRIITTSTASAEADVAVIGAIVMVGGKRIATIDRSEVFAANLACAVGVGLAMDMTTAEIAARLPGLTNPAHRRQMLSSGAGFTIIDDTYNSNPAGADSALDLLAAGRGRKVVVTPGMVELGSRQREANREFAVAASSLADDVVVIGATNRAALVEGAASGRAAITVLPSRQEAIEWVRARLGPGDTVLYENDLPDHYP
jgi:UDP-N-acetylmuramoyl-tripeptide--D-alanyl-D-alanine ligase